MKKKNHFFKVENLKVRFRHFSMTRLKVSLSQIQKTFLIKRGSLLGNEEPDIGGDSPFFEIEY